VIVGFEASIWLMYRTIERKLSLRARSLCEIRLETFVIWILDGAFTIAIRVDVAVTYGIAMIARNGVDHGLPVR